ncbi:MAG: sulfite exporter TauE/SafE family protein [Candidatus Omnitrophica bacterium]|nr:sulfite exporter TauE/SafE family protein [Candidatus Omnitrophota bacterium]
MENLFQNFSQYLTEVSPLAYLVSFLGGIAASFTPCIYPIIPILIGVIGATGTESKTRSFILSLAFVLGMAATYSILGIVAALTGKIFGQLTTHPLAYLVIGNICLFFALSMLGLFEIQLPGKWGQAKTDGGKRGPGTVFLMGASSGMVAAPCTVPVLGTLLTFVAQSRNVPFGISLLFAFACGLGLILIVLGTFTGLLTSLPKSGNWLVRIKQAFGLFLIVVAEFFLVRAGRLM